MLGIYSLNENNCDVYFTPSDARNLLETTVIGELVVRVPNAKIRVLEAKILSIEESNQAGGAEALLDLQKDPRLLRILKSLIERLTGYNVIQKPLDGKISLVLRISDEAQIAGFRASVDLAKSAEPLTKGNIDIPTKRLLLPPGYETSSN
ncbi:MAG: hypothetical protein Q7K43_01745 [Candidatus Woesearchaeota archaeon]|nr:hypothetical protein [Candidatus Woesearchaeota archaeon]